MKAIGYVRVSKQEQEISGLGLQAQIDKIELYCQMKGFGLIRMYQENAISAGNPLSGRPQGAQMLSDLMTSKEPLAVVVLKLDRIFRSAQDCLATVEAWDNPKNGKQHVALHIIDLGGNSINAQTAAGKFILTILAGAAEMERNQIKERTKEALTVKRKNGYKTGGKNAAYGYTPDEDGKLTLDPDEQVVIDFIMLVREEKATFQAIANTLNERGVGTKTGKKWRAGGVNKIVKDEQRRREEGDL